MFIDTARVYLAAGEGGAGAISFRHEIYVPKGGPDGGDGGKGGDVVFIATDNVNTLANFRYRQELRAKDGRPGSKQNSTGRSGEDLVIKVPVGTVVRRSGDVVADLSLAGQSAVIAKGGDGGYGNAHFKSSVRQTPRIAERGEPGEAFEAELELKLIADVGLIGLPNAGKSTFLSVVSNAKPEIANYPFTTITPNLGIAKIDDVELLIADIPGLIEGASQGKGLGDDFLRHVERTSVLLHLVDAYSNDPAHDYSVIRHELQNYRVDLTKRPEVVVLTKTEGLDQEIIDMQINQLRKVAPKGTPIYAMSAIAHRGTEEVLRALHSLVTSERQRQVELAAQDEMAGDAQDGIPVLTLSSHEMSRSWTVEMGPDNDFTVRGVKIERFARRTDFNNTEGVNRLRDIMRRWGIEHELVRRGAKGDSVIHIGDTAFTLVETN